MPCREPRSEFRPHSVARGQNRTRSGVSPRETMSSAVLDIVLASLDCRAPAVVVSERDEFARAMGCQQHRIANLVRRLLGWPAQTAEVEDVVQEVFLAAWKNRRQFRGEAEWGAWLSRIAVNKARNHVRSRSRRRVLLTLIGLGPAEEPAAPDRVDEDAHVRAAVAGLGHRDREVLVLRYLEQRGAAEIAEQLGLSRNTIDARLTRARRRLRAVLEASEVRP